MAVRESGKTGQDPKRTRVVQEAMSLTIHWTLRPAKPIEEGRRADWVLSRETFHAADSGRFGGGVDPSGDQRMLLPGVPIAPLRAADGIASVLLGMRRTVLGRLGFSSRSVRFLRKLDWREPAGLLGRAGHGMDRGGCPLRGRRRAHDGQRRAPSRAIAGSVRTARFADGTPALSPAIAPGVVGPTVTGRADHLRH